MNIIRPLVDASFSKAKVTCFAYGQTGRFNSHLGSGKTYTMMGDPGSPAKDSPPIPGLYLLAAQDIFEYLERVIESFKN